MELKLEVQIICHFVIETFASNRCDKSLLINILYRELQILWLLEKVVNLHYYLKSDIQKAEFIAKAW